MHPEQSVDRYSPQRRRVARAAGRVLAAGEAGERVVAGTANQHLAWIARRFGRADFLPLSAADLTALSAMGRTMVKRSGAHLFRAGEPADTAFIVEQGEVELYRGRGAGTRMVARVGPGAVVGDIAMFGGVPYHSSARAATHAVLFAVHRDRLLPELALHPALCLRWLVAALTQLERTQRHVVLLLHTTVLARVAALLLEAADDSGQVLLSQHAMARLLGVSRQSVNEALAELRSRAVIATGYGSVHVLDPQTLQAVRDGARDAGGPAGLAE